MKVVHCSRCGQFLAPSELRYIVGINLTLDLDGSSRTPESDPVANRLFEGGESLADLYYREMVFTLCSTCRDRFVNNPLDRPEELLAEDLGLLQ